MAVYYSQASRFRGRAMNEWDERMRAHRVWREMETFGPTIDAASSIEGLAPEVLAGIERLRAILTYCGKRLAAADPMITAPQPLESIASQLAAMHAELTAFVADKDAAHVTAANQSADTLLLSLPQIPGAYSSEELGALVATTTGYRAAIHDALTVARKDLKGYNNLLDESLSKLQTASEEGLTSLRALLGDGSKEVTAKIEHLQAGLVQLTTSFEAEQKRLAQILSDQQGQFSTAQEARSKEYTESLRLANEGFTKLITEYQSQFSAAQDGRSKENAAAELARQTKFTDTISDYSKILAEHDADLTKQRAAFLVASEAELAGLVTQFRDSAAQILGDIEEKQRHVEKLVGVIGNLGVTSGYLRVAQGAKQAMWFWQTMTVVSLGTLSWLAYRTLGTLEDAGGRFNWGGFAARVLLLGSLGVIAAYSGSQADKLFTEEKRNRKLALELEAIGPYLAPLPIEDQNKFRIQIGELSFGREPQHEHKKSPVSIADLFKTKDNKEFLQFCLELLAKAKDTIK